MRPGGSSGDMNSVTHGYFAPKERACLRIQPALKKKKKRNKKEQSQEMDGNVHAGQSTETQSRGLGA